MADLFLNLVNMSITAGWIVVAVVLLRLIFRRAPKWINCLLWGLVGLRLALPFSFKSILSLIPSSQTIPNDLLTENKFTIHSGVGVVDNNINEYLGDHYYEGVTVPTDNGFNMMTLLGVIWLVGVAAMVIYALVSYFRIKLKTREGVKLEGIIYLCDRVDTPFILGLIMPKIYLPGNMNESDREYVIAHERAHLKRLDHIWKPLGFALLAVYWFNPLIWVAYVLLCRDIEMACDEKVIKEQGAKYKKPYSEALLNCSVPRRMIAACPLAFGEVGVKKRIKSVLNYKKPAFWVVLCSLIAVGVAAVCLLTNPIESKPTGGKGGISSSASSKPDKKDDASSQGDKGDESSEPSSTPDSSTSSDPKYDGPISYEPLEIKSSVLVSYEYSLSVSKIESNDWSVLRFDSYKEVTDFEKKYKKAGPFGRISISSQYNEKFFETKSLIYICYETGYPFDPKLGEVTYDGKEFTAEIIIHESDPSFGYPTHTVERGFAFSMDKRAMNSNIKYNIYETIVPFRPEFVDGEVVVTLTAEASANNPDLSVSALSEKFGIEIDAVEKLTPVPEYEDSNPTGELCESFILRVPQRGKADLNRLIEKLKQNSDVKYAHLNVIAYPD